MPSSVLSVLPDPVTGMAPTCVLKCGVVREPSGPSVPRVAPSSGGSGHQPAPTARSGERGWLEQLGWRPTRLDMKMGQYRRGERFALAVCERHCMEVLNGA